MLVSPLLFDISAAHYASSHQPFVESADINRLFLIGSLS